MKFDLGKKMGHDISIVIKDDPIVRTTTPIGYTYKLDELYIGNKLIPKSKNGYYFLAEFTYKHNCDKKVFCLYFSYELADEICKIFKVKKQTIAFLLPKDIEEYFINVLNPKGEKLLKDALDKIQNEINERDKLIVDDTILEMSYSTSYGYTLKTEVSPSSNILFNIENKLNNAKSIIKSSMFDKFQTNFYWGDYSTTTDYKIKYSELKELLKIIDNKIEEHENDKALKEKEKQKHIDSLKKLAKETGEKQEYTRWCEPCNNPNEECNVDLVCEYIMPDGTFKLERNHTW